MRAPTTFRMKGNFESDFCDLCETQVHRNRVSPLGLLRNRLEYALNDKLGFNGVFDAIREEFKFKSAKQLHERVTSINDLRNTRIAHQEVPLTKKEDARASLRQWIEGLVQLWVEGER